MLDRLVKSSLLRSIETIGLLDEETLSLGIQHLHIPQKPAQRLRSFRIYTINELIHIGRDFIVGKPQSCGELGIKFYWDKIELEIRPRLQLFASSIRDGKVDWASFWDSIDYDFTFVAARLDQMFQLDEETKALRISALKFGKAAFSLHKDNIHTVGNLIERLAVESPSYWGFGNIKIKAFANGLREFIATINSYGNKSSLAVKLKPSIEISKYRSPLNYTAKNRERMSEATAKITLGQLHLHNEIKKLKKIGVQNLDQLLTIFAEGLPDIRGVGLKARKNLLKIAISADSAISESGHIDWNLFAEMAGFHTFPDSDVPLTTGIEFLASLEGVVQKLTTHCFDEVETAILRDRLVFVKKDTVSLEGLGRRYGLCRERIRQKQKKVIERISAAVLENDYEGLSFRFNKDFSHFWCVAAEYFSGTDSVSYNDFIDGLTNVWNVDRQFVIPHLPLIYAILTNNTKLPAEYNELGKIPPKIFQIIQPIDLAKPFTSLHPSKTLARAMEKAGVNSIDQLLGAMRTNISIVSKHTIERLTTEILDPLSRAVTQKGGIAWQEFYKIKDIQLVPETESDSPAFFAEHAIETVSAFIDYTEITRRSRDIFHLRTVPEAAVRKTLDQTGELLGCEGPSIKREENLLLERLNDAIFAEDYTAAGACFRASFTKHWKRAKKIYRQTSNQYHFADLLSREWGLSIAEVSKVIPMFTCIIEGKPKGYTGKTLLASAPSIYSQNKNSNATATLSVIRLRGFRSIH
jgi:hypothetical protein